jgi:7-carboxy-7-deazaguanine synthase
MLLINELFGPTVQGEGPSAGRRCVFLRLVNCSLSCVWCDTPYTWNWTGTSHSHPEKFDRATETHKMPIDDVYHKLIELDSNRDIYDGRPYQPMLVISGGEPFLQQKNLYRLAHKLKLRGWRIEVETNGTIAPRYLFVDEVDQINCSPKLRNSGDPEHKRIVSHVLEELAQLDKTNFKFVVGSPYDMVEIESLVVRYKMREVWLMPLGRTQSELARTTPVVGRLATRYKFNFSPRIHIEKFGDRRGV